MRKACAMYAGPRKRTADQMRKAGFMAPGSMPTPGYAHTLGRLCAPLHNTVPARSLSLSSKHGKLAQVSYLPSPHSPCAPPITFGAASLASSRAAVLLPHTSASRLSLPPAQPWGGDILSLCPWSLAVQNLLPSPVLKVSLPLLLLPVTTLLGPWLVGVSVRDLVLLF